MPDSTTSTGNRQRFCTKTRGTGSLDTTRYMVPSGHTGREERMEGVRVGGEDRGECEGGR